MNSGLITVHQNDPDNFIEDPEYSSIIASDY